MCFTEDGWKECSRCGALTSRGVPWEARFWVKVNKATKSGCWEWTHSCFENGYGQFNVGTKNHKTHRYLWTEILKKEIPASMVVCHRCDNPKCVNPDHLFLATQKENLADMLRKGRSKKAKLLPFQVKMIRARAPYYSKTELARQFKVPEHSIYMILSGRTFKAIV